MPDTERADPEGAVATLLGVGTGGARPLGGAAYEVDIADGGTVVAKRGAGAGAAPAEATGLRWLGIAGGAAVPATYGYDEEWLVTEKVHAGTPSRQAAERMGRALARTHAAGAPAFGSPPPSGPVHAWIGLTGMSNIEGSSWPEWYAAHRVEPYLRAAVDAGTFSDGDAATLRRVCERLPELDIPEEPPSRLHGDLWSGNVLFTGSDVVLIDPAAHGGHRETDLAMLLLFGCPHLEPILAAYQETQPLAPGWRDRVPLHQLFPLLVHTVLFGGGYAAAAASAARRTLANLA